MWGQPSTSLGSSEMATAFHRMLANACGLTVQSTLASFQQVEQLEQRPPGRDRQDLQADAEHELDRRHAPAAPVHSASPMATRAAAKARARNPTTTSTNSCSFHPSTQRAMAPTTQALASVPNSMCRIARPI